MIPKHEPKSSFGAWLLKYRLTIILLTFIILIPIAFVAALYIGDYLKYKEVNFAQPSAEQSELVSEFQTSTLIIEEETEHQVIKLENSDLIIYIKLDDILVQEYVDTHGYYKFFTKWESKRGNDISGVNLTYVLQTQWINGKSLPHSFAPTKTYPNNPREITYDVILPQSPLWFVTVERPDLYIKVTYTSSYGMGGSEQKTSYFMASLLGITPIKDLPVEE